MQQQPSVRCASRLDRSECASAQRHRVRRILSTSSATISACAIPDFGSRSGSARRSCRSERRSEASPAVISISPCHCPPSSRRSASAHFLRVPPESRQHLPAATISACAILDWFAFELSSAHLASHRAAFGDMADAALASPLPLPAIQSPSRLGALPSRPPRVSSASTRA